MPNQSPCNRLLSYLDNVAIVDVEGEEEVAPAVQRSASQREKYYITTAINYTNGHPHLGHLYEGVTSDIIARYHKIYGREVFFCTGTDEHGQKIADSAADMGRTPKEHCDHFADIFKKLAADAGMTHDRFIRTTDEDHQAVCEELWRRCHANGDIYLGKYEGYYNISEESFVSDSDAKAANFMDKSGRKLEKRSEETYHFRLSKYEKKLRQYIDENPDFIRPEAKKTAILARMNKDDEGLRDLCISRSKMKWGLSVPDDPDHVMYVWFDALTNYISAIGGFDSNHPNAGFWPADVHIIGKDITWFHTVYWPCMLMSAGVPLPKCVYSHGFINDKNGEKMSKSVGNVVDPFVSLKKFDLDVIRFYFTRFPYGGDLRWDPEMIKEINDGLLVHLFGNLLMRCLGSNMLKKVQGVVPKEPPMLIEGFDLTASVTALDEAFLAFDLCAAADIALEVCRVGNEFLHAKEPWKMNKPEQQAERNAVLRTGVELVYIVAHFFEPFCPTKCAELFDRLNTPRCTLRDLTLENLTPGTKLRAFGKGEVVFQQFTTKHKKKQAGKDGTSDWQKAKEEKRLAKELDKAKAQAGKGALDFVKRLEFKVGKVISVAPHPTGDTLYVEQIDLGEAKPRQIVSGLKPHYTLEELEGSLVCVFTNLKGRPIKKENSEGMVMCGEDKNGSIRILRPPEGSKVGERVCVENVSYDVEVDKSVKFKHKNSPYTQTSHLFRTDKNGVAVFQGKQLTTSAGSLTCDLKNSKIR